MLVASRLFGGSGQPWMWRQVVGLRDIRCSVLCWQRHNEATQPSDGIPVYLLSGDPAPYDGVGRWTHRLKNLPHRNFYGACGVERRHIADVLRRADPDVVLCHFGDIGMRLLGAAQQAQIPLVTYLHGDFLFRSNRWYRWSFLRCLAGFTAFVVVTEAERQWLETHGVAREKIHVIPCGAPVDLFHPRDRQAGTLVRFVMSSRLIAEKGCHLSIAAFARLARRFEDVELHIYGDGPAREELSRLASSLQVDSRIFFHGFVAEQRLADALPGHDVFIQHSLCKEGSPVSVVEAMAAGLSTVSTPTGGIACQVIEGVTGFLIAENDVEAMADAMERLARDRDLRRALGRAGRKRAVDCFDAKTQTGRLEQILLGVARDQD